MAKEGFAIVMIGRTKTGKTTRTKEILSDVYENDPKRKFYVYDPNLEYTSFYDKEFLEFEEFTELILPAEDSIILIEEATIFLDPKKKEGVLVSKLVRKRHQGNIIIMNFHSWASVPRYIFDMIDYVYVLKTNDTERKVKEKCDMPDVLDAYIDVKESNFRYECKIVDLYG